MPLISGESLSIREAVRMPSQRLCIRCGYISSQELCKACVLLEGLNKGLPKLGIGKSSKVKAQLNGLANNNSATTNNKKEDLPLQTDILDEVYGCGGHVCQCTTAEETEPDHEESHGCHSIPDKQIPLDMDMDIENISILAKKLLLKH